MDNVVVTETVDEPIEETVVEDDGFTPEELAMFETRAEASPEEAEEPAGDEPDDDPWAWARDKDPEKVRKTWDKFTEEWGRVAELEKQYQPYVEFAQELQSDPQLQAYIRAYYEQERTPTDELYSVRSELESMKRNMALERELGELHQMVASDDTLPPFEDREVLQYMAQGGYPTLEAAYRNMTYDVVRQNAEEKAFEKIKKTKGAAVPKVSSTTKTTGTALTQAMIDKMDDEEFQRRYPEIMEFYAKNG